MPSASTPWETPIPPPPAEPNLAPEVAERTCTAMLNLLWLTLYVTFMRLLGYRVRRQPTPRAAPSAPIPRPIQAAPPFPRRKHRYMDTDMALAMLADINAAFTSSTSEPQIAPHPASAPRAHSPRATSGPHRARATQRPAAHPTTPIIRAAYRTQRPHPPPNRNSVRSTPHLSTPISLRYQNEKACPASAKPPQSGA